MKDIKKVKRAFGTDEYGFANYPTKVSNVKVSRFLNYEQMGGCPYCFPHGIECSNSKWGNIEKNWKRFRKTQYHIKKLCI